VARTRQARPYHKGSHTVMNEVVTASTPAVQLPPAPAIPKLLQCAGFAFSRRWMIQQLARRYGNIFTLDMPFFGRVVIVGDPQLIKQVFTASLLDLGAVEPNMSQLFGSGSLFGLEGEERRRRRQLLMPLFHDNGIKHYERIIEE
jgi:cytochrome P450